MSSSPAVSRMELLSSSSSRSSVVPGAAASVISPGHRSSKALRLLAGTLVGPRSYHCRAARWDPLGGERILPGRVQPKAQGVSLGSVPGVMEW